MVLRMSDCYNKAPSDIMGISDDPYTAYCFDEACMFIKHMIHQEKKYPVFGRSELTKEEDKYSGRFANLYRRIREGGSC